MTRDFDRFCRESSAGSTNVDFEGGGQSWFIEAWLDEHGDLAWTTY